jgi:hypothetical protein
MANRSASAQGILGRGADCRVSAGIAVMTSPHIRATADRQSSAQHPFGRVKYTSGSPFCRLSAASRSTAATPSAVVGRLPEGHSGRHPRAFGQRRGRKLRARSLAGDDEGMVPTSRRSSRDFKIEFENHMWG